MLRLLLKNWKLNAIAVFSLAIALALGVVALSISNAILLRPPLARDPGQLTLIYTSPKPGEVQGVSYLDYTYLSDHARSFSSIGAYSAGVSKGTISFNGRDDMAMENTVSDNYFEVMGIRPFMGRFFTPGDDAKRQPAVVMTYARWERWGADPKIVGKSIKVGSQALTIIGVAPREFLSPVFGFGSDLILDIGAIGGDDLKNRERRFLMPVGRLRAGVPMGQARAELRGLWSQLATQYPKTNKDLTAQIAPMTVLSPDDIKTAQLISAVLVTCSLLILLIACANTANLLLALATLRRQEALIKTALGASRGRLIGEFLKETAIVCAAGGVFGYGLALLALGRLSHIDLNLPAFGLIPISADLHPGLLVVALTIGLILAASLASGLAPALYASKPNLAAALTGEIAIGGTRRGWIRGIVVGVQVAVCTLVLAGAGLCWRSLNNLRNVDPGFSAHNIASILVFPQDDAGEAGRQRLADDIRRTVSGIHGIESVALADELPLGGGTGDRDDVHFTDRPDDPDKKNIIEYAAVDENYFTTLGIRLLDGRGFRSSDGAGSPSVVVINRFMAEKYWPNQSAIGRTIRILGNSRRQGEIHEETTIVGIVANGKYDDLDEAQQPYLYHPLARNFNGVATVIARTSGDPRQWLQPMVGALRKLDVSLPLPPTTMDSWMNITLFVPLLTLGCVTAVSLLAMLLSAAGLYGAISYSVSDRRKELGIRIALGARPGQVMRMVFRQTLWIAGVGVVTGLGLSVAAGVLLADQFYRVHPVEWTVLVSVGLGMISLCLGIAFAAARRWTRMNPMDAVRHI